MANERMHAVTIDKVTPKMDAQNNLMGETREELCDKRFSGISPVVAVIKAYESIRGDGKLDLVVTSPTSQDEGGTVAVALGR